MQHGGALNFGKVAEQEFAWVSQRRRQGLEMEQLGLLCLSDQAAARVFAVARRVLLQFEGVRLPGNASASKAGKSLTLDAGCHKATGPRPSQTHLAVFDLPGAAVVQLNHALDLRECDELPVLQQAKNISHSGPLKEHSSRLGAGYTSSAVPGTPGAHRPRRLPESATLA